MSAVMKENQIVEFNEFESKMAEFKERYDGVVYDLTVPEQDKKARSDRYAIGKVISALDAKHKEIKAPLKIKTDLIDSERKRIKDQLEAVQDKIKSQIESHEAKTREKEEALQAKVDEIRLLGVFCKDDVYQTSFVPTVADVQQRLAVMKNIVIDDSFEGRKADAALAQMETTKLLDGLLAERQKHEAEQAELDRLRKESADRERADRDEAIRREAAEKAQREAETKAERERRQADAKARQEIEAAERKQKEAEESAKRAEKEAKDKADQAVKAERERIEKEQKIAAEKAEKERQAEEAKKAKQNHRNKIHKEAKQSLIDNGIDTNDATNIIELIKDGKIANVQVIY